MELRLKTVIPALAVIAACKAVDGDYMPGCPSFEGDRVELDAGAVTWDRFTDEVRLDAAGNPQDPFPDYPRHGHYSLSGDILTIRLDGEDRPREFAVHDRDGTVVLLDAAQQEELDATGNVDGCALTRTGTR
jgi:hypothetical protein